VPNQFEELLISESYEQIHVSGMEITEENEDSKNSETHHTLTNLNASATATIGGMRI
jgi:hypothetical protein